MAILPFPDETSQQAVVPTQPSQSSQGNVLPYPEESKSGLQNIMAPAQATSTMLQQNIHGAYTGALALGTTILKGLSKLGDYLPGGDPKAGKKLRQDIQDYYEDNVKQTEQDKELNPGVSLFQAAGTMGIPIPGLGNVSNIIGKAGEYIGGKLVGSALKGSGEAGAVGALYTQPGQGEDVFNKEGMKTGLLFGAPLGIGQQATSSYLNRATQYEAAKNTLQTPGGYEFKGPFLNRDLDQPGMTAWGDFKRQAGNKILDALDITGTRYSQVKQAAPFISEWIKELSNKTVDSSKQAIYNNVDRTINLLGSERKRMWEGFYSDINEAGIKKIPVSESSRNLTTDLLNNYSSSLSANFKKKFDVPENLDIKLSPEVLQGAKQDVWTEVLRLSKKTNRTTQDDDAIQGLKNLYGNLKNDVKNGISSDPKLTEKFSHINEFEQGYQTFLDPKDQKQIVNAVNDLNAKQRGMTSFLNFMLNPKTSERDIKEGMGILGTSGIKETQAVIMNKLLEKSMNPNGLLNVSSFIKNMSSLESSPQKLIAQDSIDVLSGLTKYVLKPNLLAKEEGQIGSLGNAALQSGGLGVTASLLADQYGVGQGIGKVTAAAIIATPITLNLISRYSPLKSTLRWLNKNVETLGQTSTPGTSQYLLNTVNKYLTKAGIVLKLQSDGSTLLHHKDETEHQDEVNESDESNKLKAPTSVLGVRN